MRDLSAARRPPLIAATPMLRPLPPATRHILRGGREARVAAGKVLGFDLPASACRATCAGDRAALWQGPDEWLLLSTAASGDRAQAPLNEASLEEALQGLPHSLVNVSHRQIGLELRGLHAALLLAAGCPLDLEAGAFPVGMCTRTVLAKAEVVLWRTDPQLFRLEVWRSFATYVAAFLTESARGL